MMGCSKTWITPFVKQCFVTAGVSLNMAGSGLVIGFTTALLEQLKRPGSIIPLDVTSGSWVAAIPGMSLVFGNFIAPTTMSRYGRKPANLISIVPLIIGWAAIYFANSITILLLARFLQGLCMGMCTSLGSLLIGEYTSPKNRGAFLMTISVSIAMAVMAVHSLGAYFTWQTTALICGGISFIDLFIVLYSPESPSWLAQKGKYDACKQSFRWLRGDTEEEELRKMIEASILLREAKADMQQTKSWIKKFRNQVEYFKTTVKKKEFMKPIIIMIHIYILGQWSGINMLVAFPIDLFHKMVGKDCNIPLLVLTLDVHRIVANTTALYVIQKVKRRTILGVTVCINITALIACAAYSYAKETGHISMDEFSFGIAIIHIHMFAVATGSLPLCFIIAGEIFPLEYRSLAGGISVLFYSTNLFVTIKTAPFLLSSIDLYGTYLIYASLMIYSLLVVWNLLPETKDRTLQDIEDEFRGRPLSPEELKSVQSLASIRAITADRRCSNPITL
ncbi:facilitated trehalose transporter Tret1 isoform X1 [Spodoptera frugiperda]|uniref:Facilitated trehalose transporter Tret1 isoform X1 n=2 Tax=Spodoptera frugiperda TaxID=7108 RepID=A0A9R0DJE8_SPOFR|nr:facilitated trehalose transporter Tret1 isoform X1 [Spodoptera frugiperda]